MAVPSAEHPVPAPRTHRRWPLAAAAAVVLFLGSAAAAIWWNGSDPPVARSFGADSPRVYLLQRGGIEIADPIAGTILGRLPRPGGYPHALVPGPDGRFYFCLDGEALVAFRADGYQEVASLPFDAWPRRLAISPDGTTIVVSLAEDPDVRIIRWDGTLFHEEMHLHTGGEPGALLFDTTGRTLYVGLEDEVLAVDLDAGAERFRTPIPKPHQLDPVRKLVQAIDGRLYAYYVNWDHLGAVALISPAGDLLQLREFGRVIHDIALSPDEGTLYATWRTPVGETPRRGGLIAMDSANLESIRPELDLGWAMGVTVSPDGKMLYVTEGRRPFRWAFDFPGTLVRIHAESLQVLSRRPVGRGPQVVVTNY